MEELVAIRVVENDHTETLFLTWGRVFDPVEPRELVAALKKHLPSFGINNPVIVEVCESLQEASHGQYFYEGLFTFSQERIPYGPYCYPKWCAVRRRRIRSGKDIYLIDRKRPIESRERSLRRVHSSKK